MNWITGWKEWVHRPNSSPFAGARLVLSARLFSCLISPRWMVTLTLIAEPVVCHKTCGRIAFRRFVCGPEWTLRFHENESVHEAYRSSGDSGNCANSQRELSKSVTWIDWLLFQEMSSTSFISEKWLDQNQSQRNKIGETPGPVSCHRSVYWGRTSGKLFALRPNFGKQSKRQILCEIRKEAAKMLAAA